MSNYSGFYETSKKIIADLEEKKKAMAKKKKAMAKRMKAIAKRMKAMEKKMMVYQRRCRCSCRQWSAHGGLALSLIDEARILW